MTAQPSLQPRVVRLVDVTAQPWKNGGGLTRELLVWPLQDAGSPRPAEWVLRVSVADITRDGPFSAYPGIDRGFAVLSGTGVRLELDSGMRVLTPGDEPICFHGESAPHCSLLADATQDLNLMVQRSQGRLGMGRAHIDKPLAGPHVWRGVFTTTSACLEIGGLECSLEPQTLMWQSSPHHPWRLVSGHAAYWMFMEPA